MDSVRSGAYGQLFRPDNFVFGKARSCYLFCTIWVLFYHFYLKLTDTFSLIRLLIISRREHVIGNKFNRKE